MKSGFVSSAVLHAAILTWGLWSFSAPKAFDVAEVEALPVDIVPFEALSQSVIGEKEAPVRETPAPKPTERPETLPMPAENVGENEADLETPPTPVERPREVEEAAAAAPAPPPTPEPEPVPEEPPAAEPPPEEPAPEPEVAAEPATPEPAEFDPIEEAIVAAAEEPPAAPPVPQNVPVPSDKPRPPEPKRVEAPEPAKAEPREEPKETEVAEQTAPEEPEFDADQIAALLNKERAAGGGAKRSTEQASLGTERKTGAKLSQSELDALRGQIQRCWSPPAGVSEAGSLRISIQMRLDPSGSLEVQPTIVAGGGSSGVERAAGDAALRAVMRCAPYNLPIEKYETWADVVVNFDPSEMF